MRQCLRALPCSDSMEKSSAALLTSLSILRRRFCSEAEQRVRMILWSEAPRPSLDALNGLKTHGQDGHGELDPAETRAKAAHRGPTSTEGRASTVCHGLYDFKPEHWFE